MWQFFRWLNQLLCWHDWQEGETRRGVGVEYVCEKCFKCKIVKGEE